MIVAHDIIKRRTRVQLLFGQARDDGIPVFHSGFVGYPYLQLVACKPRGDPVGQGIEIVVEQHVHHETTARSETCADGIAGLDVEFIVELETRTTDIDCDAVKESIVFIDELPEIGNHASQIIRQPKELMSDHKADRIVVDDRQLLPETSQPGGQVSAAAPQDEYV